MQVRNGELLRARQLASCPAWCSEVILRRTSELLAPFGPTGEFCGLTVEHCELCGLPDAAWKDYERDGDKEALLNRHVGFFRSIFVPSLASALRNSGSKLDFADILAQKLKRRLAEQPTPYNSFIQTMVLAKKASL
jgi:hypothetical protein